MVILWTVTLVLEAVYWIDLNDEYCGNENLLKRPRILHLGHLAQIHQHLNNYIPLNATYLTSGWRDTSNVVQTTQGYIGWWRNALRAPMPSFFQECDRSSHSNDRADYGLRCQSRHSQSITPSSYICSSLLNIASMHTISIEGCCRHGLYWQICRQRPFPDMSISNTGYRQTSIINIIQLMHMFYFKLTQLLT